MSALAALPWLALTLAAYAVALWLFRRGGLHPLLLPVLVGTTLVVGVLLATGTSYATYFDGARWIYWLVGPATVALAVPLYGQMERLRRMWLPLSIALAAGSLTAIVSALGIAWLLGGSRATLVALAPKSATMPIAMAVAEQAGGTRSLAAVAVAVTGIAGAMAARGLLALLRERDEAVAGFALGISAHAIGVARALQTSPTAGAFAALAMGLNGIATGIVVPIVLALLGLLA
ncbi:LrgB family protein [Pseudorhodoferax sp. Leaf267]|uniref:LrgB family protein n=1 Tax=Pseudorhodoferax sp. Leaf267 TaxID=1736316 RepID=UPI000A5F8976|nr:LrgB family protein [Pseudorhodoferax sp. Leaf267]